jgi:hypothetical protein
VTLVKNLMWSMSLLGLGCKKSPRLGVPFKYLQQSLQKNLDHILGMRGNIACHMQCHLAFAKCDWIRSAKQFISFWKWEVTLHVTCNVTAHSQNVIQVFL